MSNTTLQILSVRRGTPPSFMDKIFAKKVTDFGGAPPQWANLSLDVVELVSNQHLLYFGPKTGVFGQKTQFVPFFEDFFWRGMSVKGGGHSGPGCGQINL